MGKFAVVCDQQKPLCVLVQTPHRGDHLHSETDSLTEGSFTLRGDEEYVRVTVRNTKGQKAWTQPIWLWLF